MDTMVKVGAAIVAVLQVGVKHLMHLSHSTDAFAFIANQAERAANAAERAAAQAKHAARMSEVEAVVKYNQAGMSDYNDQCPKCSTPHFAWETFCKACDRDLEAEVGTGTYSAS